MTRPDLDLAHLRLFVAVAEGGIASAARSLGCTEHDVQDGLRTLEERYGHPLLTAEGPTADGRRLLTRARRILSLFDETVDALDRGTLAASHLADKDGAGDALMLRDLLGDAVGCISEGFVLFDPDGRLVLCNDRYREAYPLLADKLRPGVSFADLLRTALDRGAGGQVINPTLWVEERLRRHFDSEAPTDHRLGDGCWYRISEHATRFGGIVKVLTDITELKRHEEALAHSENRYRQLVETAPYGVIVWDGVRVRFANRAAADILGTDAVEDMAALPRLSDPTAPGLGEPLFAHLPPPCVQRAPGPAMAAQVDTAGGGVRDLEAGVHPFAIDGAPAWLLVLNDVTQRKQAERALNQSQKMQAIGQLAGGIAHEFNNMLTAIGGFAHMARRAPADRPRVEQCLGEIIKATDRAAGLTSQLLTFGRQEPGEAARLVTVAPQLEEARRFLRPILGERYSLEIDVRAADAVVLIEPAHLHQSLVNLAINSRDAMPGGGPITITLDRGVPDAAFWRRHTALRRGTYVTIQVRDAGEGIAPDAIDRIFEPFYTTKQQGEGTGLGLSLVYSTVTRAGGAVEVWSEPGQGTAFTLYFPAERGTLGYGAGDGGDDAPAEEVEDGPSVAATVLLVEDEEQVREFIRLTLEDMGMRVVIAADGQEALELFHSQGGAFDLLVSDLVMPRMGGAELTRRLREEAGDLPVVLMSGYPPETEPLDGLLADSSRIAFLHKPVNPDALAARIHALVV
ncbi:signal transduction histidine kinase/CheY-like chemotaxis protein/molybdenum-dependent DNA-binding transcriptional regulator ModE [Azospirillum fermentarium]|uniref:ATP-binding protein n=1 Tax=Azospirillum fermentarium TaxID=1233114 RepID=UPI002227A883|nr:ATP-binding protein [Azospirillum fermentarium]MCW2246331.1 signal transduction histidine kinase/CheY-like chemotaxis protein/molybdenum-dependent DNA-binding transcriptional regulator ModE [Azospirillum fermentarium]